MNRQDNGVINEIGQSNFDFTRKGYIIINTVE